MHEMSYVVRFVNLALKTAEDRGAASVRRLVVSVGEMTDVLPEYLHRYYPSAVRGTPLEGSELVTEVEQVAVRCDACGEIYHPEQGNGYACPRCKGTAGKILCGRGVTLQQVVLEKAGES